MQIDESWTLFLDRDGVVNHRLIGDYVKTTDEFQLLPGVKEELNRVRNSFHKIVVVTNQQGIGKGIMSIDDLQKVHVFCSELLNPTQTIIDRYYFAPQLAAENSSMRKPGIGMGLQAKKDFPEIDFSKSIMVGDSHSDIEFGNQLGMITVFIGVTKYEHATYHFESLADFLKTEIQ